MFDRASADGLPRQTGDFGQTLYRWGAADGPYLVLPLFGPSNVRDAIGLGVDLRERNLEALDVLEQSSLDFYVHLRSVSRQHRAAILNDARKSKTPDELVDPDAPAR